MRIRIFLALLLSWAFLMASAVAKPMAAPAASLLNMGAAPCSPEASPVREGGYIPIAGCHLEPFAAASQDEIYAHLPGLASEGIRLLRSSQTIYRVVDVYGRTVAYFNNGVLHSIGEAYPRYPGIRRVSSIAEAEQTGWQIITAEKDGKKRGFCVFDSRPHLRGYRFVKDGNRWVLDLVKIPYAIGGLTTSLFEDLDKPLPAGAASVRLAKDENGLFTGVAEYLDQNGRVIKRENVWQTLPPPEPTKTPEQLVGPDLSEYKLKRIPGGKYVTVDSSYGVPANTEVGIYLPDWVTIEGERMSTIGLKAEVWKKINGPYDPKNPKMPIGVDLRTNNGVLVIDLRFPTGEPALGYSGLKVGDKICLPFFEIKADGREKLSSHGRIVNINSGPFWAILNEQVKMAVLGVEVISEKAKGGTLIATVNEAGIGWWEVFPEAPQIDIYNSEDPSIGPTTASILKVNGLAVFTLP